MSSNLVLPSRRSPRLKGWDYSRSGKYYVTIVTKLNVCWFGEVVEGEMRYSALGEIARNDWLEIPEHHKHVELGEFIVMPNHVHGILILNAKLADTDVQLNVRTAHSHEANVEDPLNVRTAHSHEAHVEDPFNVRTPHARVAQRVDPMKIHSAHAPEARIVYPLNVRTTPKGYFSTISPKQDSVSVAIRTYKAAVTTWARENGFVDFGWHGRFHDHVIRNEQDYRRIADYIRSNPRQWNDDEENPANRRPQTVANA